MPMPMPMKWYADDPVRRAKQVALDLGVLAWVYLCVRVALVVKSTVLRLQEPGRILQDAGNSLAGGLDDAAQRVAGTPLIGNSLRGPLAAAADAGRAVAGAGTSTESAAAHLALVLALVVAVIPIVVVLAWWLPHRWRYAREAAAAVALRGDTDLLALRAATSLPLVRLARLGPDPVARWRRGDPDAAAQLAALALAELGVRSGDRAGQRADAPR